MEKLSINAHPFKFPIRNQDFQSLYHLSVLGYKHSGVFFASFDLNSYHFKRGPVNPVGGGNGGHEKFFLNSVNSIQEEKVFVTR